MTERDVDQLEKRIKLQFDRAKQIYEADMWALKRVREWIRQGRPVGRATITGVSGNGSRGDDLPPDSVPPLNPPVHHPELPIATTPRTIEGKVLMVVGGMTGNFNLDDVLKALNEAFPAEEFNSGTVMQIVLRYAGQGQVLRRVSRGGRGRKAVYARA